MRSRADSLSSSGHRGHHGLATVPRGQDSAANRLSVSSHNIADVEKMYMAMRNLSNPLPSARY